MKLAWILLILFSLPVPPSQAASSPAHNDQIVNYARPCEPAVKAAFLPLPPGAVEPAGWLRDWAQSARDGITGHLDEWHPTFADGWKGVPVKATGAKPDGTGDDSRLAAAATVTPRINSPKILILPGGGRI